MIVSVGQVPRTEAIVPRRTCGPAAPPGDRQCDARGVEAAVAVGVAFLTFVPLRRLPQAPSTNTVAARRGARARPRQRRAGARRSATVPAAEVSALASSAGSAGSGAAVGPPPSVGPRSTPIAVAMTEYAPPVTAETPDVHCHPDCERAAGETGPNIVPLLIVTGTPRTITVGAQPASSRRPSLPPSGRRRSWSIRC
jgi:hypothetical protein